jgi:CBS domain-containing protein
MKRLQDYYLSERATIKQAIAAIRNNHSRCIIILNQHKKVVGVFSEGDVLDVILNGIDVHTPLDKIIKPSFYYLQKKDLLGAYKLIKKYGITLVPIVDNDFKLKDVITILDVIDQLAFVKNRVRP